MHPGKIEESLPENLITSDQLLRSLATSINGQTYHLKGRLSTPTLPRIGLMGTLLRRSGQIGIFFVHVAHFVPALTLREYQSYYGQVYFSEMRSQVSG